MVFWHPDPTDCPPLPPCDGPGFMARGGCSWSQTLLEGLGRQAHAGMLGTEVGVRDPEVGLS